MKEIVKNAVYAGLGAAFLTKEKIDELASDLIAKGKLSKEEGKNFIEDLLHKSEKAKDQLELWINRRVEEKIAQLDLATKGDLAELERKINELQISLNKDMSK